MKGACLGTLIGLGVGIVIMLVVVPVFGGMLISMPPVTEKLEDAVLCPDAVNIERAWRTVSEGGSEVLGQVVEMTCTFADGSQKVIPNERVASAGMGHHLAWPDFVGWY